MLGTTPLVQVVMDCDPGWDDALALIYVLLRPTLNLLGVTTVYGNASLEDTSANARRILGLGEAIRVKVYPGADAPPRPPHPRLGAPSCWRLERLPVRGGIGTQSAVEFVVDAARVHNERLVVIATGPLTNIARAIQAEPTCLSRIGHLVILGGAVVGGNASSRAEFNFLCDPDAARAVLESAVRKTIVPLDIARGFRIPADTVRRLRPCGALQSLAVGILNEQLERVKGPDEEGVTPFDVMAVLAATTSGVFTTRTERVTVDTSAGENRGRLLIGESQASGGLAHVVHDVDADAASALFLEVLGGNGDVAERTT